MQLKKKNTNFSFLLLLLNHHSFWCVYLFFHTVAWLTFKSVHKLKNAKLQLLQQSRNLMVFSLILLIVFIDIESKKHGLKHQAF